MGWGSTARQAAAAEYGRQNWRRYAARRRAAIVIAALAAAAGGVAWAVSRVWRSWHAGTFVTVLLAVAGGLVVLAGVFVVAIAVRTRRW